ncbi:hypothetical protein AB0F71_04745 [Kitasatospora sp. NPDC028055]|uniref:hypothetical protein n=1 Tax=Kitasatospora sp. NPDC028055 TaxID=3155653 RepID=UPI0033C06275
MTGQHCGHHRDRVHDALKTLLVLGHLTVFGLLGITVHHQEANHSAFTAITPDSDPPEIT